MNLSNRGQTAQGGLPSQDLSHDKSNLAICREKKNVVIDSLSTRSSKEKVRGSKEREREISG